MGAGGKSKSCSQRLGGKRENREQQLSMQKKKFRFWQ